jgi:quinoprotein glucose dehydrogenase
MRGLRALVVLWVVVAVTLPMWVAEAVPMGATAAVGDGWPAYGGDAGGTRYSSLTQITPANVGRLQVAWT